MLTAMRNRAGSWVAKGFLLLLAASFGLWGVGDIFRGFNDPVVAEVGGREIRASAFLSEYSRLLSDFRRRAGGTFSEEQALAIGLPDQALDGMLTRLLLDAESEAGGLVPGERETARWLGEQPAFHGADGRFDRSVFSIAAQRQGMDEAEYLEALGGVLQSQRLLNAVGEPAHAPDRWIRALHSVREERRTARAAVFLASQVPEPDAPSEEAVRARFEEAGEAAYRTAELRDVTVALLDPEELKAGVEVGEEAVADEFERRRSELSEPERRQVVQHFSPDREEADAVLALVREGSTLSEAAAEAAGADPASLDLGLVVREDLEPSLAEAAFAAAPGRVEGPEETPFGWRFLEVVEVEEASEPVLDEVREEIRDAIALERAYDLLHDRSELFYDELAGGATLEEAARAAGAAVSSARGIDSAGRDADGAVHPDAPDRGALALAFGAAEGETTDLEDLPGGALAAARADRVVASRPQTIEEARDRIAEDLLAEARREAALAQAEAFAAEAGASDDLEALAESHGGAVRASEPFTRSGDGADPAFPREAVAEAFLLGEGETGGAVALGAGGHAVVRVDAVGEAGAPVDEAADPLRAELEGGLRNDLVAAFMEALRDAHPVEVSDAAIERVLASDPGAGAPY